jgi:signal transduction histidine kinase
MAGYGMLFLRLSAYPWPLLLMPGYPVILVYGILRWRVFVANAWARRALAWAMVTGLALAVVALVPALPLEGAAGRYASGALVAAACLTLAGPARRLAERLIYPGGLATSGDLVAWRAALSAAETQDDLAREASALLLLRLGVPVAVAVGGDTQPAPPALLCRREGDAWSSTLRGWDAAPPGARHLAELFGAVLAQEAERLERASALASRERERQTQARLAELGQLAATVAHDVRNPLNIIAMAAAGSPPDVRADIREQVDRIARLSRDLLDYARPWDAAPVPLDLREHVEAASRRRPGVEIGAGLDAAVSVRADPGRLDQALANLLDNASATGARVAVEAERVAGAVRVHVCDAGPGVAPDLRERMFLPFVSRSAGGTGLGLAIVARIMAAHGGRAMLTDRPGWSTCVTLEFPA